MPRPQFSLRWLFVLTTTVAVACFVVVSEWGLFVWILWLLTCVAWLSWFITPREDGRTAENDAQDKAAPPDR
jgi:hypothetical protein